jgi:hypothetical protein
MEASRGGAMRSPAGTVLAKEIQSETDVVLKPCWEKRTLVGGGTRTLEVFFYLPLILSEEQEKL